MDLMPCFTSHVGHYCQWNRITQLQLPHQAHQFLASIELSSTGADYWVWDSDSTTQYTVHQGYMQLQQTDIDRFLSHARGNQAVWKVLWSQAEILPKVKVFSWRLLADCLMMRANLARFLNSVIEVCPFCNQSPETATHLFFCCSFTLQVWTKLGLRQTILYGGQSDDIKHHWYHCIRQLHTVELRQQFLITLWCIWKMRNEVIFRNRQKSEQSILAMSRAILHSQNTSKEVVHLTGKRMHLDTPLQAELWAINEGMEMVINIGFTNVIVETDCLNAVSLLAEDQETQPWRTMLWIRQCRRLMRICPSLQVKYIRRQANEAAHRIAMHRRHHDAYFQEFFIESRFDTDVISILNLERNL